MNNPTPSPGRGGFVRALLAAAALAVCAAAGFLLYRLVNPPSALQVAPAAGPGASGAAATTPLPQSPAPQSAAAPAPGRRIPETLPDLALPGLDGRPHRLGQWKGHPLLVNFWASWCEPCRREIPLLKGLRHERAADRLEVVGIAVDFRDAARKYARDSAIDYPVLVGEQGGYEAVAAFGMDAVLPLSVFADGEGRIVTVKVGELHQDEADLILDRIRDLGEGRMGLPAAREQIATGLSRLSALRAAAAATH